MAENPDPNAPVAAWPELSVRPLDALQLEPAQELYDFYASLCTQDGIPERGQIDALTIPRHLLSSVYLLEPVGDFEDFRYRLIGSEIVERFRKDRTGQRLREFLPGDKADALIRVSAEISRSETPRFFQLLPDNTAMEYFYTETMSLPIRPKDGGHNWIFGGTFFGRAMPQNRKA